MRSPEKPHNRRLAARADHVILISLDGLRPEFCLEEQWPAPNLQQLCAEGAYAHAVRGVFPSLTYPAHATIVTGALPARHGIYFNEPFEPTGQTGRWFWEASAMRAPALWDAVRAAGKTSAAVSWPVSIGAAIDWNIPDVWPLDEATDAMEPIRQATRPAGLFEEVERDATGRLREENFSIARLSREDRVGDIAAHLLERYRPALLLVHLIGVDHIQHQIGLSYPEVRRAVGAADRAIGQILEAVERLALRDRTSFIITGDHGEVDSHTEIRPNTLLVEAGLMENKPDRGQWRATFHASGGSAFLRLHDAGDDDAVALSRSLLEQTHGAKELFRLVERDELDRIGADPEAPLALAAMPGVTFSADPAGPLVGEISGGAHGYFPEEPAMYTGFVGSGAGFRKGATVTLLPLENVASLAAALLGLEFDPPDGMLCAELLT